METGNLTRAEGATMFFIVEEVKETVLALSKGTVYCDFILFYFNILLISNDSI